MVVVITYNVFHYLSKWLKYKESELVLRKYEIDTNVSIDKKTDEILDQIIETAFQEYSITHITVKSNWYITEADELEINKHISNIVAERISPVLMTQLSLYYNDEAITDVIAKRIYFRVTTFVIEHNKGTGL